MIWISSALANSGRWTFTVGVGWLLYTLSNSSLWVGLGIFSTMIPIVIFGPISGVIADRFNRRKMYSLSLWLSAAIVAVLFAGHVAGIESLWFVIACSLGLGITFSAQMVSSNAMIPLLISREKLNNASALIGVVSHGAEFFGSALATPLLLMFGVNYVIGLCALLFAGSALYSMRIQLTDQPAPAPAEQHRNILRPIADGFSYIRGQPIGLLIVIVGLHCALTMSFNGLLPDFSMHHLSASGEGMYGSLMTFVGLGAVIGNLVTAGVSGQRALAKIYAVTAIGSGASLFLLAFMHQAFMAIVLALVVGGTQAVFMATSMALIMQRTDPAYQGRVSSVYYLIAAGLMAVSNLVYGWIGEMISAAYVMIATGLLFVAAFVLIGVLSSLRRNLQVTDSQATRLPL